ncbi:MAG: HAD family hydrolase [Syntrophorhabdaceae bacterium]
MRYFILATDYDGTIAENGSVDGWTRAALQKFRQTGRKVILVTGRQLDDLFLAYGNPDIFDYIVAENGSLLYDPVSKRSELIAKPPPDEFIKALIDRGVKPLAVGHGIVSTNEPYHTAILETIHDLGLELHVIFNKGSVMVLPSGINKATGLSVALKHLKMSYHNTVGIGDAENDHAFLEKCECSAAVANALPAVKKVADIIMSSDHGKGVADLVEHIINDDLSGITRELSRHRLIIGEKLNGGNVFLEPYGENVFLSGISGGGKSTLATRFYEELVNHNYQVVIIDPEGDYANLDYAAVLGTANKPPEPVEILKVLEDTDSHVVVNMLGVSRDQRPSYFEELMPRILELRARLGHPHWVVIDETHHVMPASRTSCEILPESASGLMFITVDPDHICSGVLSRTDVLLAVGNEPEEVIRRFSTLIGRESPDIGNPNPALRSMIWRFKKNDAPEPFKTILPQIEKQRHVLKYAKGDLSVNASFYFKGPDNKLNIRVQNLMLFIQVAEGIDDETWLYHLRSGDYSRWFRNGIKDDDLARSAAAIEKTAGITASQSRQQIRSLIEERYTLPA